MEISSRKVNALEEMKKKDDLLLKISRGQEQANKVLQMLNVEKGRLESSVDKLRSK